MLELRGIKKDYPAGSGTVHALKGIDLQFRRAEFVSILGPSGCGKTTMLNILGGLDGYTEGDLVVDGVSTRQFKDRDWDAYRNHSVGFVFQSYNLIPHQTVLQNVELALTLSGVRRAQRRERAKRALEEVGLGDQLNKRPNEMSGGQMQRVAIARALVNDPSIILADEPTGALDTETSVQVMEILKRISRDRLIVMVTHNPELAERYSSRIVRMLDGEITSDSQPLDEQEVRAERAADVKRREAEAKKKKPSMSFGTSFMLSLKNLFTKKGRTVLTAFAGSIGIIGIALILSLSTGVHTYIDQVQEETLASYPITIEAESVDMSAMMTALMGARRDGSAGHELDRVYSSDILFEMMDSMLNAETSTNDLKSFKAFLDAGGGGIAELADIHYSYDFDFDIYTEDTDGSIVKSDVIELMQQAMGAMYGGDYSSFFDSSMGSMYQSMDVWQELLPGEDGALVGRQVLDQYELIYGAWPQSYDEVILFVDPHNEISDLMLGSLGLISSQELDETLRAMAGGEQVQAEQLSWTYEELCSKRFKLILPAEYYRRDAGGYVDLSATEAGMDYLYHSDDVGTVLTVAGIARPREDAASTGMVTGAVGYTSELTAYAIQTTEDMEIVRSQRSDQATDVFTGLPFATGQEAEPSDEEKARAITVHLASVPGPEKAAAYLDVMSQPGEEYVQQVVDGQMQGMTRQAIEEQIVQLYAGEMGVDGSTVADYIAGMSDEELFAQVGEAIAAQVREQYAAAVARQLGALSQEQLAGMLDAALVGAGGAGLESWQYGYLYDRYMPPTVSEATYEENLDRLGYLDPDSPSTVSLYASTFADKDEIAGLIQTYNDGVDEQAQISYTDYVALLMSSVTAILDGITYVLIAFVAISLIVSSIMIGVITLISVQERTKEIGILRAIGASKRDVSSMFNAETLIVGFAAGALGVVVTYLLCVPINMILHHFTGIASLRALLPVPAALILVAISMVLTLISGLIPSRSAAKKDPVVALRTE